MAGVARPRQVSKRSVSMSASVEGDDALWSAGDCGGSRTNAALTCCCRSAPGCSGGPLEQQVFRGWYLGFRPQPQTVAA